MNNTTFTKDALFILRDIEDDVIQNGSLEHIETLKLIAWVKDIIINHTTDFSESNQRYIKGLSESKFQDFLYTICKIKYPEMSSLWFRMDTEDAQTNLEVSYKNSIIEGGN